MSHWTNNLAPTPAVRGERRQWTLTHQQEGAAHTGLLSLVLPQEARDCHRGLVSKLQARPWGLISSHRLVYLTCLAGGTLETVKHVNYSCGHIALQASTAT